MTGIQERSTEATRCIAVLGASGCAREMYWHIRDTYPGMRVVFIDDVTDMKEVTIGDQTVPVVKNWKFDAVHLDGPDASPTCVKEFVLGIGSPRARKQMVRKALDSGLRPAATIIHPRALVQGTDCRIGVGGIICPGCVLTTNIVVGDYVLLNYNTTVGHDAVLCDYVTCSPGCSVSGNVVLGEGVSLGAGTVVREKVSIAPGVVAGAQSCVVKDISEPGVTVVGIPARKLTQ